MVEKKKEEKREDPVGEFLKYIQEKGKFADNTIWSILDDMESEDPEGGGVALEKLFGKKQAIVITVLIRKMTEALDFHENEWEDPHANSLGKEIRQLEAKFRNHRHEKEKSYTAKPEW